MQTDSVQKNAKKEALLLSFVVNTRHSRFIHQEISNHFAEDHECKILHIPFKIEGSKFNITVSQF